MPLHNETLGTMVGAVRAHKPNAHPELCRLWLNSRLRYVLNLRYWSDLVTRKVIGVPAQYATGTVSFASGSALVTGSNTAWPVSDVVNTELKTAILEPGRVGAVPASMAGITTDSLLYVDAGTADAEVVPVLEVQAQRFTANFVRPHNAGAKITQSSLAGRQIRTTSADPLYTIEAVVSTTLLQLEQAWQGGAVNDASYTIRKVYYSLASDIKDIVAVIDPGYGAPIKPHMDRNVINRIDPRRMSAGAWLQGVVDAHVNRNGNAVYEFWPHPTAARQVQIDYVRQWPEMRLSSDVPPPFLDPYMLIEGALADAFGHRAPPGPDGAPDPLYDMRSSQRHEQRFVEMLRAAMLADDGKFQTSYGYSYAGSPLHLGDTQFAQATDIDILTGDY